MQLAKRPGALARSVAFILMVGAAVPALAQAQSGIPSLPGGFSINDLPPDIQQQLRSGSGTTPVPTLAPEEREPRSVGASPAAQTQPSLLEEQYSRRAGRPMEQIGYEVFGPSAGVTFREVGAAQDGYILGVGDQIVVHMRGRTNRTDMVQVDREGAVVLPEFPPIPVAGISFGEFKAALKREAAQRMLGTEIFVSLGQVREISVTMTGEVTNPGVLTLSSQASLIDALRLAGGMKKTGSLRGVRIVREGTNIPVDLYDFVFGRADTGTLSLTNGDRIYVPVIGNTVGISGQAKRPGIYELAPGSDTIASSDLLEMGGGVWVRGRYRYAALRVLPDGTERLVSLDRPLREAIGSGEILFVETATDVTTGTVALAGHARLPGPYPLSSARSVRALVRGYEGLLPDPYLPFAVIETADPQTRASRFDKFDLGAALSGRRDIPLSSGDKVFLFGLEEVRFLASTEVAAALAGQPSRGGCAGIDFLTRWVLGNPNSDLASGQFSTALQRLVGPRLAAVDQGAGGKTCPAIFDQNPRLLTFALQNSIVVLGNVLNPGAYPVAAPDGIDQVMALARAISSGRQSSVQAVGATAELNRLAAERASGVSRPAARATVRRSAAVADVVEIDEDRVALIGHVRFAGTRSLSSAPTVKALIGDQTQFKVDPYLLYGLILRRNPDTFMREVIPFSPVDAISGGDPIPLASRDVVRIFGFQEIQQIVQGGGQAPPVQPGDARPSQGQMGAGTGNTIGPAGTAGPIVPRGQTGAFGQGGPSTSQAQQQAAGTIGSAAGPGQAPGAGLGQFGSPSGQSGPSAMMTSPSGAPQNPPGTIDMSSTGPTPSGDQAAEQGGEPGMLAPETLGRLLADASVELLGQVVVPGRYPIVGELSLDKVFSAAGGVAARADMGAVEITRFVLAPDRNEMEVERQLHDLRLISPSSISVSAGTVVLINPLISQQEIGLVEIRGEVKRPGRYGIVRGEKLSSLIQRAGGLQALAYPTGAVFTRAAVRQSEAQARSRAVSEFHRALIGRMSEPASKTNEQLTPQQIDVITDLLGKLQSTDALGRMVVELNPIVLQQRPEFDVTLEGGDQITIPRRPLSVFISGEVFNPGAQQFSTTTSISEYLEAAGGVTDDADLSNAFIIRPNGSATRINFSVWGSSNDEILPGSWVVVPRDIAPFRIREFATTVTQIFSQLAGSAASIAVISRN